MCDVLLNSMHSSEREKKKKTKKKREKKNKKKRANSVQRCYKCVVFC